MFDRITFDPNIMGGRACIRGMRIPVSVIILAIASGATRHEVLKDFPDLEPADIQQALEYAAWLTLQKATNTSSLADLFAEWEAEDQTSDPAEIFQRNLELAELKRALKRNRLEMEGPGSRQPFP